MTQAEWGVLIADDELAARRGVRQMLAEFPDFHVVAECRDAAELLAQLGIAQPHVVFLDIEMPGVDSLEVVRRRTPEQRPAVVLLTEYDAFALKALDAQAFDYLVKPVSAGRFAATIAQLRRQLTSGVAVAQTTGILVSTARGSKVIRFDEIDWIESEENFVRLWIGVRSHLAREPLSGLETRAAQHGFLPAHRGALVRIKAVRSITRTPDGETTALLTSGARVPVSRKCRAEFARAVKVVG